MGDEPRKNADDLREAVKLAVARGSGIAAISRFALDLELDVGTLAILDVPRWRLNRTISRPSDSWRCVAISASSSRSSAAYGSSPFQPSTAYSGKVDSITQIR